MTSSVKPEVRNVSQRRQRKTEQRPQSTCTKNGEVRAECMVFELCERPDRQTNRHTHHNTLHIPSRGRSYQSHSCRVYLLAESTEVFDVYAGHEMRLGVAQRHRATVVLIKAMTYGASDVMWARFWRHSSLIAHWPRHQHCNRTTTQSVSNFEYDAFYLRESCAIAKMTARCALFPTPPLDSPKFLHVS